MSFFLSFPRSGKVFHEYFPPWALPLRLNQSCHIKVSHLWLHQSLSRPAVLPVPDSKLNKEKYLQNKAKLQDLRELTVVLKQGLKYFFVFHTVLYSITLFYAISAHWCDFILFKLLFKGAIFRKVGVWRRCKRVNLDLDPFYPFIHWLLEGNFLVINMEMLDISNWWEGPECTISFGFCHTEKCMFTPHPPTFNMRQPLNVDSPSYPLKNRSYFQWGQCWCHLEVWTWWLGGWA